MCTTSSFSASSMPRADAYHVTPSGNSVFRIAGSEPGSATATSFAEGHARMAFTWLSPILPQPIRPILNPPAA